MHDLVLAFVIDGNDLIDTSTINASFRWGRAVPYRTPYSQSGTQVYSLGDSHGTYNGFLGPPPVQIRKRKRRSERVDGSNRVHSADKVRVSGVTVTRDDISQYLKILCRDGEIGLWLTSHDSASEVGCVAAGWQGAPRFSLKHAVEIWPTLLNEDERCRIRILPTNRP